MNSSFTKTFEAEKIGKNKSLGKKMYARIVIMQSLKSIRLAEVDNFFKQSFEQKKTDSTVAVKTLEGMILIL